MVASALGPSPSPGLVSLLPYSVILKNETNQAIAAYTLRLTFVDADGRSGGRKRQFFNFETTSNGMEIPPGAARLVNAVTSVATTKPPESPSSLRRRFSTNSISGSVAGFDEATALSELLSSKAAITIAVDLIVFDTGRVIGPDDGNTLTYLRGWVAAEREIASLVSDAMKDGATTESIAGQLRQLMAPSDTNTIGYDQLARTAQARHFLQLAESSMDALALRNEVGRVLTKPIITFYR